MHKISISAQKYWYEKTREVGNYGIDVTCKDYKKKKKKSLY